LRVGGFEGVGDDEGNIVDFDFCSGVFAAEHDDEEH
jgi:hypothetical protein